MEKSKLLQALNLWREITGVDPNATSMSISSWGLKETFKALQEAIDLDPSEITANLLLGYFLNTYLAEREVSLLTLLNDPQGVAARLEKPRALMELLGRPELVEARDAFIAAIVMMLVSLVIYLSNKRRFPDPSKKAAAGGVKASAEEITMSAQEIRQRIYALFAVFGVVIFFWVSFHQNGYSLTYFARDYVNLDVININLGFTTIKGAEIFQSVNPFFVVTLTPLIMWFFGWLRKRNIEVSTPMKIAIGMGIAATAYLFLMFFSFALPDKAALAGMKADQVQSILVTPWVMVGLYFILTVAELFISPLGLAFVSKVAPPHMQGLMQGFWLAATAVGNALLFVGGWLYMHTPMWATWCVFVAACGMSMLVMLSMVRWLERVTK